MNEMMSLFGAAALASPLVLVVLFYRRALAPSTLAAGPDRRIGLGPMDFFAALMLLIFGLTVAVMMAKVMHLKPESPGRPAAPLTAQAAWVNLLTQIVYLLPAAVYLPIRALGSGHDLKRVGLLPRHPLRDGRTAVLGLLTALSLTGGVTALTSYISLSLGHKPPAIDHPMLREMVDTHATLPLVLLMVSAVVVAPILEETLFRGLAQSILVEMVGLRLRWVAILFASLIFMSVHLDVVNWQAMPALFVLALVLGWVYERTGDLWANIFIHAGFNAYNVAIAMSVLHRSTGKG